MTYSYYSSSLHGILTVIVLVFKNKKRKKNNLRNRKKKKRLELRDQKVR